MSGLYDPGGRSFAQAQDRHLAVAGTVIGRERTARGLRLTLDHISFPSPGTIPFPETTPSSESESSESVYYSFPNIRKTASVTVPPYCGQDLSHSGPSPVTQAGSVYHAAIEALNRTAEAGDRIIIFPVDAGDPDQPAADHAGQIRIGDRAVFYGKCSEPEPASNPGQFDSRSYYRARNVVLMMRDASLRYAEHQDAGAFSALRAVWNTYRNAAADLRITMREGIDTIFGSEDAPLACAVLLGDKSALAPEDKRLFRDGGMAFLVSVSSLHISLLGMAVYRFLRKRRMPIAGSAAAASVTLVSYALLTGMSLCAQRAVILFLIRMGAQVLGRTEDRLNALGAAAVFILLRQPYALWDASFLVSCVCIISLELIPPALTRIIPSESAVSRALVRPAAMQIGTLPVILWFFYQVSPWSFLLHPVLLPFLSILMAFGLAGSLLAVTGRGSRILLSWILPAEAAVLPERASLLAGRMLVSPCRTLIFLLKLLCRAEQKLPLSVIILGRPRALQVILYYLMLILFLAGARKWTMRKNHNRIRSLRMSSAVLLAALMVLASVRIRPHFRYTCLDIGQGSCSLIEEEGTAVLFDAGSSTVDDVWQYRIDSTLKYYGIRRLDAVILSHGDMDHVNGIEQMLAVYRKDLSGNNAADVTISRILLPDLPQEDERLSGIARLASQQEIPVGYVSEGCSMQAGALKMDVLSPSPARITGEPNEDCIVLRLERPGISILLTGDLEKQGEAMFIESYRDDDRFWKAEDPEHLTVLVAGHHGSGNATSEDMLDLTDPDLVLISCGRNNRYGHPSQEMLQRLRNEGIPWKRTDRDGAVCIEIK